VFQNTGCLVAIKNLQTKTIQKLQEANYYVNKTIIMSKAGFPDLIAVGKGHVVFIEIKEGNDKLSVLQRVIIDSINKIFGKKIAYVVRSIAEVEKIIQEHQNE